MATGAAPLASVKKAKKAAPSQHVLLDALVDIVIKHANEQLVGFSARMVKELLDVSDPSMDARSVYLRVKAGNLLKGNNYAFVHLCSGLLEKALRKEVQELLPRPRQTLVLSEASLSLVSYEEMDNKVAFDAISRPFEMAYASHIATLNVRLGFLLNRDILRIGQNPFRPEMFLSIISSAWQEFDPEDEAHPVIAAMLRPALLWDFGPMYEALCDALINKGVQPGSVESYNIRKTESAAAAKIKRAKHQASLARQLRNFLSDGGDSVADFDAAIPLIPLIPDLPEGATAPGGWRPSGAQGFTGEATAEAGPASGLEPDEWQPQGGGRREGGWQPQGAGQPPVGVPFIGAQFAGAQFDQAGQGGGPFVPVPQGGGQLVSHPQGGGNVIAPHGGGHLAGMAHPGGPYGGYIQPGFHAAAGALLGQAGYGVGPAPLLDMLRTLQARMPEHYSATPSAPGPAMGGDAFYLPRLKESIPKGSLTRGDESTIDLLSKIFDTVFVDPNIPKEIRDLIQFLQIPVLKAALADQDFFFEETHPARRMINLLSSMGMEQRSPEDPVFQAMKHSVDKVGQVADEGPEVFSEAVAELEASIKAEESFEVEAIAAPIAAALKQEKMTAATRSARTAVAARVSSGEVVAVLETFLEHKWISVLTVAYSLEDEKPGAVNNAMRTMDDLIWSVKPKITHAERRELIGKLPGLLATLNKWLDIIKWNDADRVRFFAELAECHASIVRAPLDITPERQLEIAVEVAQEDAMRRLEKDQAAAEAVEEEVDEAIVAVETLERGAWLEFEQSDGSMRKAKLAWVSPLKTLFIFSLGARKESFSLPVEKLTAGIRAKKVRVVQIDGVVERALSEAMGAGAVNDIEMGGNSAAA